MAALPSAHVWLQLVLQSGFLLGPTTSPCKPELDKSAVSAHARLERAREEETAAQKVAAIETIESVSVALAMCQDACAQETQSVVLDVLMTQSLA